MKASRMLARTIKARKASTNPLRNELFIQCIDDALRASSEGKNYITICPMVYGDVATTQVFNILSRLGYGVAYYSDHSKTLILTVTWEKQSN